MKVTFGLFEGASALKAIPEGRMRYAPNAEDRLWARFILRVHGHGEVWLWREKGVAFHVDKKKSQLELCVRVRDLWDDRHCHRLALIFLAVGYRIVLGEAKWIDQDEYVRHLEAIKDTAPQQSVIDYGGDLVRRVKDEKWSCLAARGLISSN